MKKQNTILGLMFLLLGFVGFVSNNCKEDTSLVPFSCNGSPYSYLFDTTTRMFAPNAFTPNGDGRNDVFGCVGMYFSNFLLTIKDQSGITIFSDTNISNQWDGKNLTGKIVKGYYTANISFKNIVGTTIVKTMNITLYTDRTSLSGGNCFYRDQINPKMGFIYQTQEILH
jgi:gliding motility-associated-like protein